MTQQPGTFRSGERVRITRGSLASLVGTVAKVTVGDLDCLLEIDGWPRGSYLAISSTALEPASEELVAADRLLTV